MSMISSILKTAVAGVGFDVVFVTDTDVETGLTMLNATSITGVRISKLSFPKTAGAEYAVFRTYSFDAEAEYPFAGTQRLLLEFTETLSFEGGEPIYAFRSSRNMVAQKQLVTPFDTFRVKQRGHVVGYRADPIWAVPGPKWPSAKMRGGVGEVTSPTRMGNGFEGYGRTWSYEFESVAPLSGTPTLWVN